MKHKSDTLTKFISLLLFLALAAYAGFSVLQRSDNTVRTALAVEASMTENLSLNGLIIRCETLLQSDQSYIDVTVSDGEKVSAGQIIASAYATDEALTRAAQLRTLEQEILDMTEALSAAGVVDVTDRDSAVTAAVRSLSEAVARGDYADAETASGTLGSLLFDSNAANATEDALETLRSQYAALQSSAEGETAWLTAPAAGTFTSVADGYEGVLPEAAYTLTPATLRELMEAEHAVPDGTYGKLVTGIEWYYAALADADETAELEEGDSLSLTFSRYLSDDVEAELVSISPAQDGEQVLLLRMEQKLADMLSARIVSAEAVRREYTGLRVPTDGLYYYYAGYVSDTDAQQFLLGDTVTLRFAGEERSAFVSDRGSVNDDGNRLCVFCWSWDQGAADSSAATASVITAEGSVLTAIPYYDYDAENERLCVFTLTGLQAERKKVELVYAGADLCLVRSEGTDALHEGDEIILQAKNLYYGRVFS